MAENRFKERFKGVQTENHITAAWANIRKTKPVSNVAMPGKLDIENAKEWVDTNEK